MRTTHTINAGWEFCKGDVFQFDGDEKAPFQNLEPSEASTLDDGAESAPWRLVHLPHTWNAEDLNRGDVFSRRAKAASAEFGGYGGVGEKPGYYRGVGCYRRPLFIPEGDREKKIFLYFDGANQTATVYINGEWAGCHRGGYTAFCFDITRLLRFGETNWIHVKVSNAYDEEVLPIGGDLGHFGGLYRHVHLIKTAPVHFDLLHYAGPGVLTDTPEVSVDTAKVRVRARVVNESSIHRTVRLVSRLFDPDGDEAAVLEQTFVLAAGEHTVIDWLSEALPRPRLWSPEHPQLYRFEHRLESADDGTALDAWFHTLGFRWFSADAERGFFLNGKRCSIRGIGRHQDSAGHGYATPYEVLREDTRRIKRMGCNFMRGHYPLPDAVYDEADRLGVMALNKIPIMDKVGESPGYAHYAMEMLREMILQQYNHPSIALWGYGCEMLGDADWFWPQPRDPARLRRHFVQTRELAQQMEDEIHRLDGARLTSNDFHTDPNLEWYKESGLTEINDINGWNIYQGWYHGDLSKIGPMLDQCREQAPHRPFVLAEFGAGTDLRVHAYDPTVYDMTPEHADRMHKDYIEAIDQRPWAAGMFIWTWSDFQRTALGDTMMHINNKGMVTNNRHIKDTYYLYKAHWNPEPMVRIAEHDWTRRVEVSDSSEAVVPVQVYANTPKVELFLNGASLGVQKMSKPYAFWNVPMRDGPNELEALGITSEQRLSDRLVIDMQIVPHRLSNWRDPERRLCVNVGNERCYLHDPETDDRWLPDRPYSPGGFGRVGGRYYRHWPAMKAWHGIREGVRAHINGTEMAPIYQTFAVGVDAYRFDVPDGQYDVSLYLTEPFDEAQRKDASNPTGADETGRRVFDMAVNGKTVFSSLNIAEQFGARVAVCETVQAVARGDGIVISFTAACGEPLLSGVAIKRLN